MNVEEIREFALSFLYATESMPFRNNDIVVYKVGGKVFLMIFLDRPEPFIYLKCDREYSAKLREHYRAVVEIPHFGGHWIGLYTEQDMRQEKVKQLITNSYEVVYQKLPKRVKSELETRGL